MQPFRRIEGPAAPLPAANLDTDQIYPGQFLTTVERTGLGRRLFHRLRYDEQGQARPDFVLNRPAYRDSPILVAGENFACGSSREHAAWTLLDFGVRCVIAPSFGDIFFNNAANNGLLLVTLARGEVDALMALAERGEGRFSIDLEAQTVTDPAGAAYPFAIDPARKRKLLLGLDAIGETLQHADAIDAYERRVGRSQSAFRSS